MVNFISNSDHYKEVLSRVQFVKQSLWIGAADIKDLYVEEWEEQKAIFDTSSFGIVRR